MNISKKVRNLDNWSEVTRGLYRYVIAPGAAYELHVIDWDYDSTIDDAIWSAYVVGEWQDTKSNLKFSRECLCSNANLKTCLDAVAKDAKENIVED